MIFGKLDGAYVLGGSSTLSWKWPGAITWSGHPYWEWPCKVCELCQQDFGFKELLASPFIHHIWILGTIWLFELVGATISVGSIWISCKYLSAAVSWKSLGIFFLSCGLVDFFDTMVLFFFGSKIMCVTKPGVALRLWLCVCSPQECSHRRQLGDTAA